MGDAPITVVFADNHHLMGDGMRAALGRQHDFKLVGHSTSAAEAIEQIRELEPDVAVLDMRMELEPEAFLAALAPGDAPAKVVFLSAYVDGRLVHAALKAGASGYVSKESPRSDVWRAIRTAAGDGVYLCLHAQKALAEHAYAEPDERPALTDRELPILRMLVEGAKTDEIAAELHLSPKTIKTHLGRIYAKLGAENRAAATAEAVRRGLVT
jgi:two-component system, NarL family, nitrate/nitrite response regulator NarL